jgi:hypothetical protein
MIEVNISKKLGCFIHLSRDKAIELIESLSNQMIHDSPNVGRKEFYDDKGQYFSVAVTPDPKDDRTSYGTLEQQASLHQKAIKKAFLCQKQCLNRYQKCFNCGVKYGNFKPVTKDKG